MARSTHLKTIGFILLSTAPLMAERQILPAGSLIQCTTGEKISSLTEAVGDPIACQVTKSPSTNQDGLIKTGLPHGAVLTGEFSDYKDPGHFVGKGWMLLTFDRVLVNGDTPIGVNGKVVNVKGYKIDRDGRILGKGHPVRDVVEWSIPILWPIDLINLPRRGPKSTLKPETQLTVKLMDDLVMNTPDAQPHLVEPAARDAYGFTARPMSYVAPAVSVEAPQTIAYYPPVPVAAPLPPPPPASAWLPVAAGGSISGTVAYAPRQATSRGFRGYPPAPSRPTRVAVAARRGR